jgi:hypothetical protein
MLQFYHGNHYAGEGINFSMVYHVSGDSLN